MPFLAAWLLAAGIDPALAARLISTTGSEAGGYGRLVLTFDKPVTVKATVSGGVLILGYGERAPAGPERLSEEMPSFIATVRRDPDGTGLRAALQRPVRANVQAAGEKVFVDLLPESWKGPLPSLPQEVVAELARRARAAEEALAARIVLPPPKALPLDLALLPTLTRFTLRLPEEVSATLKTDGPATRLRIAGRYTIDPAAVRGRPRPGVAGLTTDADEGSATVTVTPAEGFVVTGEREEGFYYLDVVRKAPPPVKSTAVEVQAEEAVKAPAKESAPAKETPSPRNAPAGETPPPAGEARPAAPRPAAEAMPTRPAGTGLVFPFAKLPAAALFERGGIAFLAFETTEPLAVPPKGASGLETLGEPVRAGPLTLLRFALPAGRLVDLTAVATPGGPAWELSAGEGLSPSSTFEPSRRPSPSGEVAVSVPLPRPRRRRLARPRRRADRRRALGRPRSGGQPEEPPLRRFRDPAEPARPRGAGRRRRPRRPAGSRRGAPHPRGRGLATSGAPRKPDVPLDVAGAPPSTGRPGTPPALATCATPCAASSTPPRRRRRSSAPPPASPSPAPPSPMASTSRLWPPSIRRPPTTASSRTSATRRSCGRSCCSGSAGARMP